MEQRSAEQELDLRAQLTLLRRGTQQVWPEAAIRGSMESGSGSRFRPSFLKTRRSLFRVRGDAVKASLAENNGSHNGNNNGNVEGNGNHGNKKLSKLFLLRNHRQSTVTSDQMPATRMASLPLSLSSSRLSSQLESKSSVDEIDLKQTKSDEEIDDEEDDKNGLKSLPTLTISSTRSPLRLPSPPPANLTTHQQKRRHIIGSLVHSENNYVATLQRLVNDYKRPLEESQPPIMSESKIATLFHRIPEILQTHLLFRIALAEAVNKWDSEEKMGDVFVANFSKAVVLEIYSDFINNFSVAMECAKQEAKRKAALADFLKVKQITAHDRVGFFGLMVKPVQRFPQFILLLQDLLKETPPGHCDRMALQLALTTLESLAEMLNERKREAEQFAAFRDKIRNIAGKSNTPLANNNISSSLTTTTTRYLLKEDDVLQLEFNNAGLISRSKQRRLLLLNDLLLCVTVNGRTSDAEFGSHAERLTLKWAAPVRDVEIVDGAAGGTLARLLAPGNGKRASVTRSDSSCEQAESLAQDMADLMHDFEVVSRIGALVQSLRCDYEGLSTEVTNSLLTEIQSSIRQKDEQMAYMDACCLQLVVNKDEDNNLNNSGQSSNSNNTRETFTFQTSDPSIKKEWIVELHLAQLALDPNNSPGWDVLEQERSVKLPLFVRPIVVFHQPKRQSELTCGCSYTLKVSTPTRMLKNVTYVIVNASDTISSNLRIFTANHNNCLKELGTIEMRQSVRAMVFVPGLNRGIANTNSGRATEQMMAEDQVWVATDAQRLLVMAASDPDRGQEVIQIALEAEATCISYHLDKVWVGLSNGHVLVCERDDEGIWDTANLLVVDLDDDNEDKDDPVSCLLPIAHWGMYVARGFWVHQIDGLNNNLVTRCFSVKPSSTSLSPGHIHAMAQSGVGLWIALRHSPTICLYHIETFRHLQDINIASNVRRVLTARGVQQQQRRIFVTAMSVAASRGLLWVGTNVGIALTVPLPRLEGVPIISGRANISYHAHFGPITFFLNVNTKVVGEVAFQMGADDLEEEDDVIEEEQSPEEAEISSNNTSTVRKWTAMSRVHQPTLDNSAEIINKSRSLHGSRRVARNPPRKSYTISGSNCYSERRGSKTLPRLGRVEENMRTANNNSLDDVYGLYGELLNVRDYDYSDDMRIALRKDNTTSLMSGQRHKSDPELDTKMSAKGVCEPKMSRPRSLDMSSWSMMTSSSSGCSSGHANASSANVSRNESFMSDNSSHDNNKNNNNSSSSSGASTNKKTVMSKGSKMFKRNSRLKSRLSPGSKKSETNRTVTTLMGGRGYINWRRSSNNGEVNNNDAFLVVWEMKV